MKCAEPYITVAKGNGHATCGCGWSSSLVRGGALGATFAWSMHVAESSTDDESLLDAIEEINRPR